ncbi:hypothetical protein HUT16_17055 [Kitasatospora sp. NA04385]|uniref:hypothetical protein n=1 Tax=Kitasatospora sp. NA04385 TaxID=2742135 RepID=UPI00159278B3|nr:hypothetical protein [Kitasatospora sp. NA04385]QKW20546.1 hypothetical protein HUT16_17055 [Kitasatospora sp. NA04385]
MPTGPDGTAYTLPASIRRGDGGRGERHVVYSEPGQGGKGGWNGNTGDGGLVVILW